MFSFNYKEHFLRLRLWNIGAYCNKDVKGEGEAVTCTADNQGCVKPSKSVKGKICYPNFKFKKLPLPHNTPLVKTMISIRWREAKRQNI